MNCPNCANEIPEGRKACGFCGVKIISSEIFLCPSCGEEIPAGVKACGYCGTLLEKPSIVEKKAPQPEHVKPKQEIKAAPKPKPEKKVKNTIPEGKEPTGKAGRPKWLLPVFAGVVITALGLVYFFLLRPSPSLEPALPAVTPIEEESYTFVFWECNSMSVSSDDKLAVYHYWLAKEEGQIDDYVKAVNYSIKLNGEMLKVQEDGVGELEQDPEGVKRRIWLSIGSLQPGEYEVTTSQSLEEVIFDGWDWFGPGTEFPGITHTCHLTVE